MSQFTPNSFQVPNAFVDDVLNQISDAACKIYLVVCRKTRGWNKEMDSISLSQLEAITGKSRPTVIKAKNELINVGLLVEMPSTIYGNTFKLGDETSLGWTVKFPSKNILLGENNNTASKESLPLLVKIFNYASKNSLPLLVKILYTQKTLSKDTIQNKKINKKSKCVPEQPKAEKSESTASEKPSPFDANMIELPANVNRDLWIQFSEMRLAMKKPLTENAVKLILNKLIGFGPSANQSLENAIIGNYQGVYEPKAQSSANQNQQQIQRRRFGNQADQNQMRTVGGQTQ
ncbi:replication protein [Acinetobacter sp. ANC 4470]|uniref:replication protein n=1 Tax=Acinetobacter sp. ANC 4470 TaxID=1977881 RepID=UPI000A34BEA4|nr:replication protein [Acinetobacter sp. ANC 4470]OTG64363.1 replication protein [Acinetobacter sp. ANC 4470]